MAKTKEELYHIGYCYYFGKNDYPLNYEKAYAYFLESAKSGCSSAMNMLGVMYETGKFVQKDVRTAFEWYNRAVKYDPKSYIALSNIGNCYYNGVGTAKNLDKAYEYYKSSIENGLDEKSNNYAIICARVGDILMYHYNYKKEAYWYYYSAATVGNNAIAWHNLGYITQCGEAPSNSNIGSSTGERLAAAKFFFEKAAALGFGQSMYDLGAIYLRINDKEQAKYWYTKSAQAGYEPANKALRLLKLGQSGSLLDLILH